MALADFQPERVEIKFKGGSVFVRGLSCDDVSILLKLHLEDLDAIIAMYSDTVGEDVSALATARYALKLVNEAPALVAHAIALAADEPNAVDAARKLPMPTQIEALKAIGRLTFAEAGGAKKFFESLTSLLGASPTRSTTTGSRT